MQNHWDDPVAQTNRARADEKPGRFLLPRCRQHRFYHSPQLQQWFDERLHPYRLMHLKTVWK